VSKDVETGELSAQKKLINNTEIITGLTFL